MKPENGFAGRPGKLQRFNPVASPSIATLQNRQGGLTISGIFTLGSLRDGPTTNLIHGRVIAFLP